MIHVEQRFDVRAPRADVWAFLVDAAQVAACMPGVEDFEAAGDDRYRVRMGMKVGPIKARFDGEVAFVDKQPPASMRLRLEGKDTITASKIRMTGTIELAETEAGAVTVTARGEVDVLGALGKYGQGVADKKAAEIAQAFTERMRARVERGPGDASA